MTMHAHATAGKNVRVYMTYGPVQATIEEHYSDLRSFWHALGEVLDELEKEDKPGDSTEPV